VPCAILTFLVVHAAPRHGWGPRSPLAFGQPVTERPGGGTGTPGPVLVKPARLSLIPGGRLTLIEYELRACQIRPVGRPGSSNPSPGKPGHIKSSGKPGGINRLRRVRANPPGIWMTWRRAAFEPPLTPPSVVCGRTRQPR